MIWARKSSCFHLVKQSKQGCGVKGSLGGGGRVKWVDTEARGGLVPGRGAGLQAAAATKS